MVEAPGDMRSRIVSKEDIQRWIVSGLKACDLVVSVFVVCQAGFLSLGEKKGAVAMADAFCDGSGNEVIGKVFAKTVAAQMLSFRQELHQPRLSHVLETTEVSLLQPRATVVIDSNGVVREANVVPRIWEGEGYWRSETLNPVNNDYWVLPPARDSLEAF